MNTSSDPLLPELGRTVRMFQVDTLNEKCGMFLANSSAVEQVTVNHLVVGSIPTSPAIGGVAQLGER